MALSNHYLMSMYLAPEARWRSVMANFIPGAIGSLIQVYFLAMRGYTRFRISSNIAGGILMKFQKALWSSRRSSTISWSYKPNCLRLSGPSHFLDHTCLLCCLRCRLRAVTYLWRAMWAFCRFRSACSKAALYQSIAWTWLQFITTERHQIRAQFHRAA